MLYFEELSHHRPVSKGSFALYCLVHDFFRDTKLSDPVSLSLK